MVFENIVYESKRLRKLIIPLVLEQLFAVSIGMVDTFMVSTVGEVAVSGVSLVDNINRLIIQVMSAFAAGGGVLIKKVLSIGIPNVIWEYLVFG